MTITYGIPYADDSCVVPVLPLTELRALRLWHWRRVTVLRKALDDLEYAMFVLPAESPNRAYFADRQKVLKRDHAMHMGAVQTLNSFFAIGDTAKRDDV